MPRGQKADDNEEASDKEAGGDKDAGLSALAIATSPGLFAPVAISLGLFAPVADSPGLSTPIFITPSLTSTIEASVFVCFPLFSFPVWPSLFSFLARYTISISTSQMRVFRSISLPLKYDYAIQRLVSLLKTSKKRLQLDIDKDNKKKL